jgi:hypothetical protein
MTATVAAPAVRLASASIASPRTRGAPSPASRPVAARTRTRASSSSSVETSASSAELAAAKRAVLEAVEGTSRGLRCDDARRAAVERAISALERLNPTPAPAASPLQAGSWEVMYSTAPPPSNGALGPFPGVAYQDIDYDGGTYVNRLVLPRDWLGATLSARWERIGEDTVVVAGDLRRRRRLRVSPKLFSKKFKDVERVWDQTFVDADTRVVRAARTMAGLRLEKARGRRAVAGDEDDCVFVMKRVS